MRTIYIAHLNRHVSLGEYVAAIKAAKANPEGVWPYGLTTWWRTTGAEIMQQFRRGMHERITEGIPYSKRGLD